MSCIENQRTIKEDCCLEENKKPLDNIIFISKTFSQDFDDKIYENKEPFDRVAVRLQNSDIDDIPADVVGFLPSILPESAGYGDLYDANRETWGKKIDFLLSVIGFAVDLANVWRFPYYCYKNGGGAFLIPYLLMLVIGGIPLFYMELALGQYVRKGAITCWGSLCPLFKGVGFTVVMIAFYTDFFYNVLIAWALYYFFASFSAELPWTTCNHTWNTKTCFDDHITSTIDQYNSDEKQKLVTNSSTSILSSTSLNMIQLYLNNTYDNATINNSTYVKTYPADEYYSYAVLGMTPTSNFQNIGQIRWQLAICLLAVYLICYFSLWKGISMSGKVVWFTAIFPYIVLIILFFRGITLPGAMSGIEYYIRPNISKLASATPWIDAATQVFFSLGPGFGVLLAFASYNKFNNNVFHDALLTSTVNCLTSFLSGFVVFSVIGYLAHKRKVRVDEVMNDNPGLVFSVYPEALATLPGATFWSVLFFLMLLTLGLDSSFGGSEAIITAFSDEFPIIKKRREIFVLLLFIFYYLVGLPQITNGGIYVFNFIERYCVSYSILVAVFFETVIVSWIYGVEKFRDNVEEMIGTRPGLYWKICWKYLAPMFILFNVTYGLIEHKPLQLDNYVYPYWANIFGWCIALSSLQFIVTVAIYKICCTKGSLRTRIKILITPTFGPNLESQRNGDASCSSPSLSEKYNIVLKNANFAEMREDRV